VRRLALDLLQRLPRRAAQNLHRIRRVVLVGLHPPPDRVVELGRLPAERGRVPAAHRFPDGDQAAQRIGISRIQGKELQELVLGLPEVPALSELPCLRPKVRGIPILRHGRRNGGVRLRALVRARGALERGFIDQERNRDPQSKREGGHDDLPHQSPSRSTLTRRQLPADRGAVEVKCAENDADGRLQGRAHI
jgi:hypothetical protein